MRYEMVKLLRLDPYAETDMRKMTYVSGFAWYGMLGSVVTSWRSARHHP